jgi:branched-subunit amino acid ABC-type transport system permease component
VTELVQLLVNGLVTGSVIAIGAVGVSLVFGILKIINFAHGDYLTFGAFTALYANLTLGLGLVAAALFAVAATLALSVVLEYALWRPMRRRRAGTFSLFIVSIGLALILRDMIFLIAGPQSRRYDVDVFQVYTLGDIRLSQSQLIAIAIAAVVILAVGLLLARTPFGRSIRALSDDPELAAVAGIDTGRAVVYTWMLAGALAGLGGVLSGLIQTSFDPNMGSLILLPIFAAVVLGGIGSAYGALVGGLVLGVAMELSTWDALAGGISPVYKPVVAFGVLGLGLLLRPQGLFGRARLA